MKSKEYNRIFDLLIDQFENEIGTGFREHAANIEYWIYRKAHEVVERFAGLLKGKLILDCACGGLPILLLLASLQGAQCYDLIMGFTKEDASRLNELYGIYVHYDFDLIQQKNLPFDENSMDVLLINSIIAYFHHSPKALFERLFNVLSRGGIFYISTIIAVTLRNRIRCLIGQSPHIKFDAFGNSFPYQGHVHEYAKSELRRVLQETGFDVIYQQKFHVDPLSYPIDPVEDVCESEIISPQRKLLYCSALALRLEGFVKLIYISACTLIPNSADMLCAVGRKQAI